MPHDPALVSESRAWFRKAAADLRAADVERAADPPLFADIPGLPGLRRRILAYLGSPDRRAAAQPPVVGGSTQ
jgi:hypothetical protein